MFFLPDDQTNKTQINLKPESSREFPHLSAFMVNSPYVRGALQNDLEVHTFLNAFSSIEMSKSMPIVSVRMAIPKFNPEKERSIRTSSNLDRFYYPDNLERPSSVLISNEEDPNFEVIYFSTFSIPQTAVNMNDSVGRIENFPEREIVAHDLTRPFMTIKSLDLDVTSAAGLISYKSGKLSLVLHDRTRLKQISQFVNPALMGHIGAQIEIEYGWSHPDGLASNNKSNNPIGNFINKSRVKEVYQIVNSAFNLDKAGSVNIDLSIAMHGGEQFRSKTLAENPVLKSKLDEIKRNVIDIQDKIKEIFGELTFEITHSENNLLSFSLNIILNNS